jgi:hypothetical protein
MCGIFSIAMMDESKQINKTAAAIQERIYSLE